MSNNSKAPEYYHTITKMYNHSDQVVDRLVHGLLHYTKENNIPIDSQLEIKITKVLDEWARKDERTNKYFYFFVPHLMNSILAAYFCYVDSNTIPGLYDVVDGSTSAAFLYYENPKYKIEEDVVSVSPKFQAYMDAFERKLQHLQDNNLPLRYNASDFVELIAKDKKEPVEELNPGMLIQMCGSESFYSRKLF